MVELTIVERIKARAIKDPAFRQAVLSDPRTVLAHEYNIQLPDHITVHVLEEAANTLSIILPTAADDVQELSDADLEAVAGGKWDPLADLASYFIACTKPQD